MYFMINKVSLIAYICANVVTKPSFDLNTVFLCQCDCLIIRKPISVVDL